MSAAKFKINKVSYIGRFLSLIIIFPLWVLASICFSMLIAFENIEKLTSWLFFETLNKIKETFPLKGDDDGE